MEEQLPDYISQGIATAFQLLARGDAKHGQQLLPH